MTDTSSEDGTVMLVIEAPIVPMYTGALESR